MKAVLIEDRPVRQKQYLDKNNVLSFEKYKANLYCMEPEEFTALKNDLDNDDFSKLNDYDLIMLHASAFSHNQLDKIKILCGKSQKKKSLVLFSGGISSSFYDAESFPFLNINSKDFYSVNLTSFLANIKNNNKVNLLLLQFGDKWEASRLMSIRERIGVELNTLLNEETPLYKEDLESWVMDNEILNGYFLNYKRDSTTAVYESAEAETILREIIEYLTKSIQKFIHN
ncbi:hypothetical protein [Chitinophaga sp.]|uniref:hypothetical protein n=1 Tax=Chitinophaga sp. TaxID=1869181 RepID=UPI0031DDB6FE